MITNAFSVSLVIISPPSYSNPITGGGRNQQGRRAPPIDLASFFEKYKCNCAELAKHLKISNDIVEGWCLGAGFPDPYQAMEISKYLECDLKELYLAIINTPPAPYS